jgi:hypothetical protein
MVLVILLEQAALDYVMQLAELLLGMLEAVAVQLLVVQIKYMAEKAELAAAELAILLQQDT